MNEFKLTWEVAWRLISNRGVHLPVMDEDRYEDRELMTLCKRLSELQSEEDRIFMTIAKKAIANHETTDQKTPEPTAD